jgi:hypothetical protein
MGVYLYAAYRVRVFVRVFVGVFVWVGFCITCFNLGRLDRFVELDQAPECIPDILQRAYHPGLAYAQERVDGWCEVLMWRMWCVVDVVRGQWMWRGVYVVCMWCVCEVRGVGGVMSGKCVVSAVCVGCTACKVRVAWRCKWCVWFA